MAERADLGIAWDGDADRCFFIDDKGEFVPGDFVTALLGEAFAAKRAGVHASSTTCGPRGRSRDRVAAAGGRRVMNRVGPRLHQEEDAGRERRLRRRGLGPLLLPRQLVRRQRHDPGPPGPGAPRDHGRAAQRAPGARCASATTSRARSTPRVADVRARPRAHRGALRRRAVSRRLDGVSVDYDDWHFNVRPSNTEPLLRLNLEAGLESRTWRRAATRCWPSSARAARLDPPEPRRYHRCRPVRAGVAQLVEYELPKLGVAGSNPVARSSSSRGLTRKRRRQEECHGNLRKAPDQQAAHRRRRLRRSRPPRPPRRRRRAAASRPPASSAPRRSSRARSSATRT